MRCLFSINSGLQKGYNLTMDIAKTTYEEPVKAGYILDPERPVLCYANHQPRGYRVRSHRHPRAQVVWAVNGAIRVVMDNASWIVPPTHAVWIPSNQRHQVSTLTDADAGYLYIDPSACESLAQDAQVLEVTPLMRELTLRVLNHEQSLKEQTPMATAEALNLELTIRLLLNELAQLKPAPLFLPSAKDRRLHKVMHTLVREPGNQQKLEELADGSGASIRTLERLFKKETGMSFQQWRTRRKLLESINRLVEGESSAAIAHSLGYRSSSAFVAAFRRHFGVPPQSFIRSAG